MSRYACDAKTITGLLLMLNRSPDHDIKVQELGNGDIWITVTEVNGCDMRVTDLMFRDEPSDRLI